MRDETLRRVLGYRRFTGVPRVLVLDTGYHVLGDALDAARGLGWALLALPTRHQGRGEDRFVADLLMALVRHRPDFVLTVNHLGFDGEGVLSGLLDRYQIPLASWFVDHPLPILGAAPANVHDTTQLFCVERTALPWLRAQGYRDPVHLPSAASAACHPARVDPARAAVLGAPLCFVGDSWWRRGYGEPPALVMEAERFCAHHPLDKRFVADGLSRLPLGSQAHRVVQVALAQAACTERVALAAALAPLGLRVYGDPHWAALVPGLELRSFVDPRTEAPAVFAGSAINVNITAPQLPTAANQRVWDVPGSGGFLLTDAQEDVLAHFRPDEEVVVYGGVEEAVDRARYYLARPEECAAIATRAWAVVERAHRYPHRLDVLYQTMRARFA